MKRIIKRMVTVKVRVPVTVTLVVHRTVDEDEEEDTDHEWQIARVDRVDCDVTPRTVEECADDETLAELDRLAEAAEDLE